ncbi:hypothetical protein P3G55_19110 [Leptospira sp. 96542]|nr:hypothetical protein [Leptospira sp. 96542]
MMTRKFSNLSILFGFLVLSLCLMGIVLAYFTFWIPISSQNHLVTSLERYHKNQSTEFINSVEFFIREGELPFEAKKFNERIRTYLGLDSVSLYDDSFRLLHSTKDSKQVFHNELRNDPKGIRPGNLRDLSDGDIVYRDDSGKYFVVFSKMQNVSPKIQNANTEYGYHYWFCDEKRNQILYTNDDTILSGDRDPKELLELFSGKEGKYISWVLDGEESKLIKIKTKEYSVYLLNQKSVLNQESIYICYLAFLISFSAMFFGLIIYRIKKGEVLHLKRRYLIGIIVYLIVLFFYQKSGELFPDFRYYKPWTQSRLEQFENNLSNLEQSLLAEELDTSKEVFKVDPIVKELYLWEEDKSDVSIRNRFGTEFIYYLKSIQSEPKSELIESEFDLLFVIPRIDVDGKKTNIYIVVLNVNELNAKKENDFDEFYFPIVKSKLSQNKSKEQIEFNPRRWNQSVGSNQLHLNSKKSTVGFLNHRFDRYYINKEDSKPGYIAGLIVYRYVSFPNYLVSFGFLVFLPWIGIVFWSRMRSGDHIKTKEEITVNENQKVDERLALAPRELVLSPTAMEEKLKFNQEGIETNTETITTNLKPVKKTKLKIFPPAIWKKTILAEVIQKKRETIFNPELKELVDLVKSPSASFAAQKPEFSNIPEEKKFEYSLIDKIYRGNEISIDGIVNYTKNFIARFGSPRFSYMFLNDALGSYHSQISSGLDYNTRSNLIFLHRDPYLQFDENGFTMIEVDENVRLNRFISKKFSWEILIQTEAIIAFELDSLGFYGVFMVLLNKEEKQKFLDSHKRMIFDKLKQVIPALHVLVEKEEKNPEFLENGLSWMVRSFLQSTLGGKSASFVFKIFWPEYDPKSEQNELKDSFMESIEKLLEGRDRLMETSPNTAVIISVKDIYNDIKKLLKTLPFRYELKSMKFPDDGQNYYLYF